MHVTHLLSGLQIGGLERAALRLARAGLERGQAHDMLLYDRPFRSAALDFDPEPVPVRFLPRGGGLDAAFAWRLSRQFRAGGAEVVHAHNQTALFYAVAAARLLGRRRPRVVGTFHSWPAQGSGRARRLNRLVAPAASVAAVSRELADRLKAEGWLRRCRVIRNGAALHPPSAAARAAWRQRVGVADEAVLVGHVGRMDPVKRHQDLLQAAEMLRHGWPGLVFLLVGEGALRQEVGLRAARLGNVRLIPQVTDIPGLLQALDLFVLCSEHEGTPLALLEAMAAGLPAVSTRVGGIPEMLGRDEEAGLLVPPRDPAALARAIGRLAGDAALRAALGATARRRAAAHSFEAEWAAYASLYAGTAGPGD